ncbi:MAG: hypothetical protein M1817_002714 [Caeruleum heppii]|nr:MAG: hypothetical protein M1817_002714 [Caeruleum heppii]
MGSKITPGQIKAVEITERLTSVLSLLGCGFIIVTFLSSSYFHKPINRLVFYASFGNIITNVATLVSTSGIEAGLGSPLCQFQAFIIQMFMPADSLWTLAMACNVYLTFFKKYNQHQLRRIEWKYLVFCYGVPALPAFVFLFVKKYREGQEYRIYGNAVLWCWISKEWDVLRVAAFYGPVWIVILSTMAIYVYAGYEIFQKRRQLRAFKSSGPRGSTQPPTILPILANPFTSTKTTEVHITSEAMHGGQGGENGSRRSSSQMSLKRPHVRPAAEMTHSNRAPSAQGHYQQYSVTIESGHQTHVNVATAADSVPKLQRITAVEANKAAWSYTRIAFFFFVALLVTWVPSSVNRVYGLVHPTKFNFPLNYTSSLVLPLQGFWNAIIYILTSLPACKALWYKFLGHAHQSPVTEIVGGDRHGSVEMLGAGSSTDAGSSIGPSKDLEDAVTSSPREKG